VAMQYQSHLERMLAGELYSPEDKELQEMHRSAVRWCNKYNATSEADRELEFNLLETKLGTVGLGVVVKPPFRCDYGVNIYLGKSVFLNFDCVILDCNTVEIGDRTMLGPGVHIYAADHPREAEIRAKGLEMSKPVRIGADVWIGGRAIICPGVTIGDGSIIGAGSVVVQDIPAGVIAVGNPCRVLRELSPDEVSASS